MAYTVTQISRENGPEIRKVQALLASEGLKLDRNLDYICGVYDDDDIVATGSVFGATLRCFAVNKRYQGRGLLNLVITNLVEYSVSAGNSRLFIYAKCQSTKFFEDLGFYEIARVDGVLSFMENRKNGFHQFCRNLTQYRQNGVTAAIVMNANPFTLGHLYLVEKAARACDYVHIFVLSEDTSLVPFAARWQLVQQGVAHLPNVYCHKSGPYIISNATFPSYFLEDNESVIRNHALLDVSLFGPIAQALGATVRYAGTEPNSKTTSIYNQVMAEKLPTLGISYMEIPRLALGGKIVSASTVREAIQDGHTEEIRQMLPPSTWDYLHSTKAGSVLAAIRAAKNIRSI